MILSMCFKVNLPKQNISDPIFIICD